MPNANQIAKQAAAKRRQLKDLQHKAELTRLAFEQAKAEAQAQAPEAAPAGQVAQWDGVNWLDPEGKALPFKPNDFVQALAPGPSDTLGEQTPYSPRDWIKRER